MRQKPLLVLSLAAPLAACNAASFGGNTSAPTPARNNVTHQQAFASTDGSDNGGNANGVDSKNGGGGSGKTTTNQNSIYSPSTTGGGSGGGLGTNGGADLASGGKPAGLNSDGTSTSGGLSTTTSTLSLTGPMDTFCFDDRSAQAYQGHNYDQGSTSQYSNAASSLLGNGITLKFYKVSGASDKQSPGTLTATVADTTIGKKLGQQLVSGTGSLSVSLPQPAGLTPGACYNILLCDSHAQGTCTLQTTWAASAQGQGNQADNFSKGYLDAAQGWLDDNSQGGNRGAIGVSTSPVCMATAGGMLAPQFVILSDGNSNQLYPTSCTDDNHISPLVIDFGGKGVALSSQAAGVRFDLRGDGKKEQISWPAGSARHGDACFVALDRNGNGQIDDGTELFGNYTPGGVDGKRTANGFLALRSYKGVRMDHCADLVAKGVIAAGEDTSHYVCKGDEGFGRLKLWCDANADGRTDAGELVAPESRGIVAFDTNFDLVHAFDGFCNETKQSSVVLGVDPAGKTVLWHVFDVWFNVDATKTPPCS